MWAEDLFFQQEAELGFTTEGGTELFLETVGPYMRQLLSNKTGKEWWDTDARYHFIPSFFNAVQRVIADDA